MDKPWKVIAAFVGVFIAGSVFGGLLAMRIGGRILQARPAWQQQAGGPERMARNNGQPLPGPGPGQGQGQGPGQGQRPGNFAPLQVGQVMRRYADRLDLTADQKEKIRPMVTRATEDLRRQQQTTMRDAGIVLQRLQEDMSKELSPDQRKRLAEMEEQRKDLMRKGLMNFGEPGDPRGNPQKRNGGGLKNQPRPGDDEKLPPPEGALPPAAEQPKPAGPGGGK